MNLLTRLKVYYELYVFKEHDYWLEIGDKKIRWNIFIIEVAGLLVLYLSKYITCVYIYIYTIVK